MPPKKPDTPAGDWLLLFRRPVGVTQDWVPTYWVESTAPQNVDSDNSTPLSAAPPQAWELEMQGNTEDVDPDEAVREIAAHLQNNPDPAIVLTVHGFNNSKEDAWKRHLQSYLFANHDPAIRERGAQGLVCIGYRWPSEKVGAPVKPLRDALMEMPPVARWLGALAVLLIGRAVLSLLPIYQKNTTPEFVWQWLAVLVLGCAVPLGWIWREMQLRRTTVARVLMALMLLIALDAAALWHHQFAWTRGMGAVWGLIGFLMLAIPLAAFGLRAVVYFRDVYRATHYAVLDLVELIRNLDEVLQRQGFGRRVKLSFIGHSMGAYVVTQVVRILSDVFANVADTINAGRRADDDPELRDAWLVAQQETEPTLRLVNPRSVGRRHKEIGRCFALERLVLASPDIPAEALMTRRANYLGPCLRRFKEATLFSNEGDVVLGMVSTLANSFSFPTRSAHAGYRLGNVQVVAPNQQSQKSFGIINLDWLRSADPQANSRSFLNSLRVGYQRFDELQSNVQSAVAHDPKGADVPDPTAAARQAAADVNDDNSCVPPLPLRFNYFDCTDYVDVKLRLSLPVSPPVPPDQFVPLLPDVIQTSTGDKPQALLTRGLRRPMLRWFDHISLLANYSSGVVDVHGGYFDGATVSSLIYRMACLGFDETLNRMLSDSGDTPQHKLTALDTLCRDTQLQVLLSQVDYNDYVARK